MTKLCSSPIFSQLNVRKQPLTFSESLVLQCAGLVDERVLELGIVGIRFWGYLQMLEASQNRAMS